MATEVRRFRIHGRVQGVGFRAFVWRTATGLGLTGWVRNRRDGTVEAVVRGLAEDLDAAAVELGRGSRWSRVDQVEVIPESVDVGPFKRFDIRSTR